MSTGRTEGSFIKDLRYEKYFIIMFEGMGNVFAYAKPEPEYRTFVNLTTNTVDTIEHLGVCKFKTKSEAQEELETIPEFQYNHEEVFLEIKPNTFLPELL